MHHHPGMWSNFHITENLPITAMALDKSLVSLNISFAKSFPQSQQSRSTPRLARKRCSHCIPQISPIHPWVNDKPEQKIPKHSKDRASPRVLVHRHCSIWPLRAAHNRAGFPVLVHLNSWSKARSGCNHLPWRQINKMMARDHRST